jgi:hypothetical protein
MLCAVQVYDQDTQTSLWVAADGTKLDFGDICDEDYYDPSDPEGGQLFDTDDEPDDENFEGYTGNAGVRNSDQRAAKPKTPGLGPRDRPRSQSPPNYQISPLFLPSSETEAICMPRKPALMALRCFGVLFLINIVGLWPTHNKSAHLHFLRTLFFLLVCTRHVIS